VNLLFQIGRYFFAIPIITFGIQYFLYGFVGGLPPVPPWTPGGAMGAYLMGAFLVTTGVSIAIGGKARWSGLLLGSVFLLCVLLLHGRRMHDILVDGITRWGHFLFALPMVIFGFQHFQFAPLIAGLIPSWIPAHLFWAYFTGVAFIAAAVSIMIRKLGQLGATSLGIMFLLWVVLLHAPRVLASLHNGDEWSSAFVALAMSGGAFIVAGTLPDRDTAPS